MEWLADVDVFEQEAQIAASNRAEGAKREGVDVPLEDDMLMSRVGGGFSRIVRLPEDAAPEGIDASRQNGLL